MEYTAKALAQFLKGEVEGDPDVVVSNVSKIEEGTPGTLTFLANPKYTRYIYTTRASVVLVDRHFRPEKKIPATLIRVDNPYQAMASLLELAEEQMKQSRSGIHDLAYIHPSALTGEGVYAGPFSVVSENTRIGKNVQIFPHVYIGENCTIGDKTVLYPGVKIYHGCHIGSNCIIHAGTIIGSDGFGFAPKSDSNYQKVPQIGNVVIENDVEIGANTAIDRATMGSTRIRRGVKIDNLVQIAHNVEIGDNTVMAGQCGIAGSTRIGKNCMLGGQAGVVGHLQIADHVKIAAQSGVTSSIKTEGEAVQGAPSFNFTKYQKSYVFFRKLPELHARLEALEKEIRELKNNR
ncbi:MAG: UDP-3-O-(3-hydroxymyristoyl)glucosamine N-acyltransferase [Bacteroidales bacterium]